MLDIWEANLDATGWPPQEELPEEERARTERQLRPLSQRRWTAARWALRGILAGYLGSEPAAVELRVDDGGKPRLADPVAGLRFNLSHSHGLGLVAVASEREVGVDVEWIDPERDFEALARRMLDPGEIEALRSASADSQPEVFYAAWARREALGKCLGVGLASAPAGRSAAVADLEMRPGFAGAVAIEAATVPPLRRLTIGSDLSPVS
ncbi:MAG TPA: 4'-phosphopantetheinyl transferase superfamily protein [Solirubrobacterales bacterium]